MTLTNNRKILNLFITTCSCLFIHFFVSAQYEFKIFENKDGFNSPDNYFVYSDSRKLLWSGGSDGLTKYNGKSFSNFSKESGINDSQINCIAEDKNGMLICGTLKGVSFFDGSRFENIPLIISKATKSINKTVTSLFVNQKNEIFAGTLNGLFKYNSKLKSFVLISEFKGAVSSIEMDPFGRLIVATKSGLFLFRKDKRIKMNLVNNENNFSIYAIKHIKNNLYWAGTTDGVVQLKRVNDSFKIILHKGKEIVAHMLKLKSNQFLFCGNTGMVYITNSNRLQTYDLTKLFSHIQIKAAAQDYQGNIWFATTLGLIKMYKSEVQKSAFLNDEAHVVASIANDKNGVVYFGTIDGLVVSDNGKIANYRISDNPDDNFISSLTYKNEEVLVGTFSGKLFKFSKGKFRLIFNSQKYPTCIYRVISESKNNKWIASFSDVIHIRNGKEKTYNLSNQYTQDILMDKKKRLWFANLSVIGYIENDKIHSLNKLFKKYNNYVTLSEDKNGAMWIGTYGNGILRYYKGKITPYTISAGLTNNFVSSSFYDKKTNILWIGTMYGVSKIQLDSKSNIRFIQNYLNDENIESYGCVQNAICQLDNGKMLFSVGEELFEIKSNSKNNAGAIVNLQLQIDDLFVNRKNVMNIVGNKQSNISWSKLPHSLDLNSNENNLDINFSAINFVSPYVVNYAWKLDGYDEKWTSFSDRNFANYTNLPYGNYKFKVKAKNQNGQTSAVVFFCFTIKKPYYLEWWFILSVIVTFLFILFVYFQKKIQKIKKIETEKAENYKQLAEAELKYLRSQMNPHFMFNTLNAIQEIVLKGDSESSRIYFADFAKMMRMILSNSSEKLISLEREIEFLQLYLRFETIRFQEKFEVYFNVDAKLELYAIKIPGMLLQPLIENAINHGLFHKKEKGILTIHFYEEFEDDNKYLICTITDNGIGIHNNFANSTENHQSKSTKISQERIAILNLLYGENKFKLTFKDLADTSGESGTKVIVKIALN
jgi:ligand-binding sensor domain-containing protein